MKKAFLFILALLLLSACGAPAAEPVETPSESAAPVTGPQEEAYTFTSLELALSFPVSEELAPKIAIKQGVDFFDEGGDSLSICLIMPDSDELDTVLTTLVKVPRREFFSPEQFYRKNIASFQAVAASAESIYVQVGPIGGVAIKTEDYEYYSAIAQELDGDFFRENLTVTDADGLPELQADAVSGAAEELEALGSGTMTRAEAAVWAFDLLTADNKAKEYPLNFTDVEPGTEEARAIAYLDSYGLFYGHDAESFRPDEPITRAEFVQLLQRMQLARLQLTPYPTWYGDPVEASDLDESHWAYNELNRAWQDGWMKVENGQLRPDDPITYAEISGALSALSAELAAS